MVKTSKTLAEEADHLLNKHGVRIRVVSKWVGWTPPKGGWVKLNTDGARKGNSGMASAGGLIRDHRGCWILGFTVNIGITNNFNAKCWGLREGLRIARDLNIKKVVTEMDSEAVINLMREDQDHVDTWGTLLNDCKAIAASLEEVDYSHVLRDGNSCVDWLANYDQLMSWGTTILEQPLDGFVNLLQEDAGGQLIRRIR